jgi:hypothetical protein
MLPLFHSEMKSKKVSFYLIIDYYIQGQYDSLFPLLSEWYDNYCFDENLSEKNIFNSTSVLFFLKSIFRYDEFLLI